MILLEDKHLLYQAKDGLVELISIKPENKNLMKASDYINGHPDIVNKILK